MSTSKVWIQDHWEGQNAHQWSLLPSASVPQKSLPQSIFLNNCKETLNLFIKYFIYLFVERGEGREKERERNINLWLPLLRPLLETWPRNPAMCPDCESNRWPFGSQAGTQSNEPHQPGLILKRCVFTRVSVSRVAITNYREPGASTPHKL